MKIKKEGEGPKRLDQFLIKKLARLSRSFIQKKIKEGKILVNNQIKSSGYVIKEGDIVEVDLKKENIKKEKIDLNIIFEDKDIIVIDKPKDLIVYPVSGKEKNSVFDILKPKINIKGEVRAGIVHRLDRETTGLMVVAKNKKAESSLIKLFKKREIEKGYIALVHGHLSPKKGRINIPIERGRDEKLKRFVAEEGKEAVTLYEVKEYIAYEGNDYTLVEVRILTGRTHQIRVHFQAIGHPLVGEKFYTQNNFLKLNKKLDLERQFLHAYFLRFFHPVNGGIVEFTSSLPEDLSRLLNKLRGLEKNSRK